MRAVEVLVRWMTVALMFSLAGCDRFSDYAAVDVTIEEDVADVAHDAEQEAGNPGYVHPGPPGTVGNPPAANNGADGHSSDAIVIGKDERDDRGVRVGGENGVLVGDHEEVDGVLIGGKYGVMAGSDDQTNGVRVGGENGVVMGADDDTRGVRVGGEKGVEVDVKKGVSIGGKKLFGKK